MMENYEKIKMIGRGTFGSQADILSYFTYDAPFDMRNNLCGVLFSFSIVYLFRNISDGKLVVIKQISVQQITNEEKLSTDDEVKVLSMLHHPLIIEYFTSFIEDDILSIVMEYAAGGTLGAFLRGRDEALEEEDVLNLFCQILLGLEHIHSKDIVHRDLTTDNIFLTRNHKMIKIGDFGISKILASKSKANTVVGTPCYMSPELCQGRPYNHKSDIWALGCVLYEMLTLKRAFEAPTLPNLVLKIMEGAFQPISHHIYDVEIYKLMNSMLHLKPEFRPSVSKIRVHPIILQPLYSLFVNLGNIT